MASDLNKSVFEDSAVRTDGLKVTSNARLPVALLHRGGVGFV